MTVHVLVYIHVHVHVVSNVISVQMYYVLCTGYGRLRLPWIKLSESVTTMYGTISCPVNISVFL